MDITDKKHKQESSSSSTVAPDDEPPKKKRCLSPTASRPFALKKWNAVALWNWDTECDTCAICRVLLMEKCLQCQEKVRQDGCFVNWGDCGHSFHKCCMEQWMKQSSRCPLCQKEERAGDPQPARFRTIPS